MRFPNNICIRKNMVINIGFVGIFIVWMMTGCGTTLEVVPTTDMGSAVLKDVTEQPITEREDTDTIELKERCKEIALFCQELFFHAEKEESETFPNRTILTQDAVDNIEKKFADAGYPVINSDSKYPSYLENADGLLAFWDSVKDGEDAQQEMITVSSYACLYYYIFQYIDGQKRYVSATISWDESNHITITEIERQNVIDWGMTKEGDFYYQIYPFDRHWDAYNLIRLKSADRTLYDLNAEYILSIGYINKNIFLIHWSDIDYQDLSFNDLFEYLYRKKNGDYFNPEGLEFSNDVYWIPADLFEDTILPYFDISLNEFREKALYDDNSDTYPWQEINVDNVAYFPTLMPEVTGRRENEDGTITLTVDVMCLDRKADPLFTHEVTVRADGKGNFQYLANQITYTSDDALPDSNSRIPKQWHVENTG